jgi:hypothetical protein
MAGSSKSAEVDAVRQGTEDEALPLYSRDGVPRDSGDKDGDGELNEQASRLRLDHSNQEVIPDVVSCLTHLKLLRAFEQLKQKIGYTDGLWDIWDSRSQGKIEILAKLREKRWAVYVARAVDRYEAWWKSFVPDMLTEKDMLKGESKGARSANFQSFTSAHEPLRWSKEILPPPGEFPYWTKYCPQRPS